jgi:hypothetical protein
MLLVGVWCIFARKMLNTYSFSFRQLSEPSRLHIFEELPTGPDINGDNGSISLSVADNYKWDHTKGVGSDHFGRLFVRSL